MEHSTYFWIPVSIFFFILLISFVLNRKNTSTNANTFSKIIYYPLGFLTILLLTPALAYLLTFNASNFEGAAGFAFLYLLPIIFIGLLILWFLIHKSFIDKRKKHKIVTCIFGFLSTVLILLYGNTYLKEEKQRIESKQNSYYCQKQYKDGYTGFVIDTIYGNLKVRKMDSTYTQFKYPYGNRSMMKKYFYKGQKIGKHPDYEKFEVLLKNGEVKEFTIPCYK